MVSCRKVVDQLSAMLDDCVDCGFKAEIKAHLRLCRRCAALYDSTRKLLIISADERIFELPVGFSERLHDALQSEMEQR